MKDLMIRLMRLNLGLFLFALGIVMTMKANMGYAPWEVFHAGIGKTIGMSIGNVSIVMGIVIGVIALALGERLGLGTILNMVLIGIFIDGLLAIDVIPLVNQWVLRLPMFLAGIVVIAFGSYFYIGSGFGAGPRDSMMVALTRKTGFPIGWCRGAIELFAVCVGWVLGGMVGLGTVVFVLGISFFVQMVFKGLKFDATQVVHQTIDQTWQQLVRSKG